VLPCELWYPAPSPDAARPLVLYSHHSAGHRRAATFLCTHLASHGYVVAAPDHSQPVVAEPARRDAETGTEMRHGAAHRFLAGDVVAALATRGVEAVAHLR
jgi:predicted dienelactone hydrolase